MADNHDVDDPFRRPESTVIRPRPGARQRSGEPVRPRSEPSAAVPLDLPRDAVLGHGLNPLVQAASPLLILTGRMRGALSAPPDLAGVRRHILDEVRQFERRARDSGVTDDIVLAARYVICAALDEAVLSTPWGSQGDWSQQPLLVTLHREAWGGEKFFDMLERVSGDPDKFIDLIELQYLCLVFGFAGKYHVKKGGQEQLTDVQRAAARRIREHRRTPPAELSVKWRGLETRRNPVVGQVPLWVVAAVVSTVAVATYVYYSASLAATAAPVLSRLAQLG